MKIPKTMLVYAAIAIAAFAWYAGRHGLHAALSDTPCTAQYGEGAVCGGDN